VCGEASPSGPLLSPFMSAARIPCPNCGADLADPLVQIEEGRCRSCRQTFDVEQLSTSTTHRKDDAPQDGCRG